MSRLVSFILHLLYLLLLANSSGAAPKNKKPAPPSYVRCTAATYSYIDGIRKVGHVYEFTIKTSRNDVVIDSVWFGNTPVPCDVIEFKNRHKAIRLKKNTSYIVRANKDLYANYPTAYDSTEAHRNFKTPFPFTGTAFIMYTVNGRRFYTKINKAILVKAKSLRR